MVMFLLRGKIVTYRDPWFFYLILILKALISLYFNSL